VCDEEAVVVECAEERRLWDLSGEAAESGYGIQATGATRITGLRGDRRDVAALYELCDRTRGFRWGSFADVLTL